MKDNNNQRGSLTLETAIVLPVFIFIILFIFSLFGIFSAHNQVSHALVQSAKSLSLDPYLFSKTNLARESVTDFWGGASDMLIDIFCSNNDPYFTALTDWNTTMDDSTSVRDLDTVKKRFVAYLTGGDEDAADDKLRNLGVVDGLDGVQMESTVENKVLSITISYSIKLVFDFWDNAEMPVSQTVKVRLWE